MWVGLAQLKPVRKYRSWTQSVNTRHSLRRILKKLRILQQAIDVVLIPQNVDAKSWLHFLTGDNDPVP